MIFQVNSLDSSSWDYENFVGDYEDSFEGRFFDRDYHISKLEFDELEDKKQNLKVKFKTSFFMPSKKMDFQEVVSQVSTSSSVEYFSFLSMIHKHEQTHLCEK